MLSMDKRTKDLQLKYKFKTLKTHECGKPHPLSITCDTEEPVDRWNLVASSCRHKVNLPKSRQQGKKYFCAVCLDKTASTAASSLRLHVWLNDGQIDPSHSISVGEKNRKSVQMGAFKTDP